MIKNLIPTYLKNNKRIVLPGLGTLVKKNDDGSIVFVQFLNQDDGTLCNLISSTYNIESSEAQIILKNYIDSINTTLNDKGEFLIDGVGMLKLDYNDMLFLEPFSNEQVSDKQLTSDIPQESTSEDLTDDKQSDSININSEPQTESPESESPIQTKTTQAPKTIADKYAQLREMQETRANDNKSKADDINKPLVEKKPTINSTIYNKKESANQDTPTIATKKKKTDMFLVFAILAALVALFSIIYGYLVENSDKMVLPANTEQVTEPENSQK